MSYPYLSDLIFALTGYQLPLPLPMFGLCVAAALLVASSLLSRELTRLYAAGKIGAATVRVKGADGQIALALVPPQQVVPDFTLFVMLAGILGARTFHILEHIDLFMRNPQAMIFSTSGLSIFGGLIFGTLAGLICVKRWRLPIRPLLDATAPSMMLGYAIGRIGCQVSGDGDWGIAANMALKPDWLPNWLWAQTYTNNIYGEIIAAPGVYPTPLYETGLGIICFVILWSLRKRPHQAGWLFSIYLLLAGVERFFIEQIRVNPVLNFAGIHATQAEVISVTIFFLGLIGVIWTARVRVAAEV
jgi:phosphatidylglycerol:prolipoprotein diacylglycerol transferase